MPSDSYSYGVSPYLCGCSYWFCNAGWLDCPSVGDEIFCLIPSKVPLGEAYHDCIIPGKRYSFKQVIHQQRVFGRKVSTRARKVLSHSNVTFG